MSKLNSNNFLIWDGDFTTAAFDVIAVDDTAFMFENGGSVSISILDNDTATFGINESSIIITEQDNDMRPAIWNVSEKKLIYYVPDAPIIGIHNVKYVFYDIMGNISNEATIAIDVRARTTGWRGYQASAYCLTSSGSNTGAYGFTQLEKFYFDDQTAVTPAVLKSNTIGDADYIAPSTNYTSCPLATMTARVSIHNLYSADVLIYKISFYVSSVLTYEYIVNIGPYQDFDIHTVPQTYSNIFIYGTAVTVAGDAFRTQVDDATYLGVYSTSGIGTITTTTISAANGIDISIRPHI